jgi:dTDP-4-amino-4,6-dideoxygalactose transaminase
LPSGYDAEASLWSFQVNSAVPAGNASVITTSSPIMRNELRTFRYLGKRADRIPVTYGNGFDFRLSELEAAITNVQIRNFSHILEARKRDFEKLQSIAPCLLSTQTNYHTYPVHTDDANQRHTVSCIYCSSEQLVNALAFSNSIYLTNFVHSNRWANIHRCLPLGEGIWDGMEHKEITKELHIKH